MMNKVVSRYDKEKLMIEPVRKKEESREIEIASMHVINAVRHRSDAIE